MIQKKLPYFSHIVRPLLFFLLFLLFLMPTNVMALLSEMIAVLPFKIYMPGPADNLAVVLQEMLTTRLANEGLELINPSTINTGELSRIKVSDLDILRRVGREKEIDWVIKGSLTQIGKKISLDLTIIPTSANKRPSSIFVVGDGIDKLDQILEKAVVTATNRIKGIIQVDSVFVEGNKRIETDAILAVIESRKGTKYDPAALNKDLRSIYEMGFFEDIQIDTEEIPGGKNVTFRVSEKPSITKITLLGTERIDQEDLMQVLGIKKYSIMNRNAIKDSVKRLKDHYHRKGFYHVDIKERIEEFPNNEVALIYQINEGDKAYIREISFEGNSAFDDDDLKDIMDTSEKGFFSFFTQSGHLDKKNLDKDIFKVESFYQNKGYINARVGEPEITYKEDEGLKITVTIHEGTQYTVGKVMLQGDLIKDVDELYQSLKITKEEVYNREVIRSDTLSLREIYSDNGYAFVDISPDIKKNDKQHKVDITYNIVKGKKVRFERIRITGNDKTRDKVIRRELSVIEGGYFCGGNLKRSTQNLHRLGFFEEVEVNTKKGSSDEEMILDIHVKERPTGMLSFGIGYSSVEHTIGTLQISQENLFGRGQSISAKASTSSKATRYTLSFIEPWLFDKPLSGGIDLYDWEYEYDEYTKESRGGKLKFGFPLRFDFTRGTIIYTYDDSFISDVSEDASQEIKDVEGSNITSSLTFGVSRDSRDKRFNAKKGSVNSLTVEYAGGFLGGDNYFTKYRARSAWLFPFFWDTAFSVQGRLGYIDQRPGGKLPVYEKFRLGGMNTVRGFEYGDISPIDPITGDRIGGEKMMCYNVEWRFPLVPEQGIVGVLFFDAGNVFPSEEDYTFSGIRMGAGAGIRWYSPMGPLRLEWGKNLDPKFDEPSSNWEFSIGTPF